MTEVSPPTSQGWVTPEFLGADRGLTSDERKSRLWNLISLREDRSTSLVEDLGSTHRCGLFGDIDVTKA
jgi:hypothetical protein